MKKTIFTCLFGDYDQLNNAPKFDGWDSVLFTDKYPIDSKGWEVRIVKTELSPEKESRQYKFLSHIFLSEYDLVCYIDANMILLREPPIKPFWLSHPNRRKVSDEAKKIIQLGKANFGDIDRQMKAYYYAKFPDNVGLFQNGFFVRRHSQAMNALMEKTFDLIKEFTSRDQLALPFAVYLLKYKPEGLTNPYQYISKYIKLLSHSKKTILKEPVRVHHITPARSDKNFGKAINEIIEKLPENDWICLRDIDTFPPLHNEFIKQIEELANDPKGYSLFGCMTNRIGLDYQLAPGMFDNYDIKDHVEKATELLANKRIKPLGRSQTVGGVLMLFSKQTWIKAGKFPEGGIRVNGSFVDYHFSKSVSRFGKLGIAENIYLFHNYRFGAKSTRLEIKHLI